ncbi:pyridoxal phosphate-dependent aminotransferase [Nocardioides sp. Soil796]|uniref:pyridoxal phosphate-dependent aminotransferase n=1 Tax=Nocardioides sp. Soil796 TaxID=1736412 RepID=UPI00070A24F3|nr:pyridoxal phosphate-dependent aminotransferase [Nocardioides sp. Soil796]KRF15030.1 aspartate aminotransferase [Nocardioides sp. Soil796]
MTDRYTVASRANVPPFHVMDLLAAAGERQRSHGDMVNFVAGQPSSGAPAPVLAEAIRLLGSGDPLGYTVATGIPDLRDAIAGHHQRMHGIDVHRDDVVVTTGSSGGFLLAFLAAFEPGDRVAMARPGYACYRNVLRALGCEVVELDCGAETRFQPTVAQLEQLDDIKGLVVASPANPTGTMLLPEELAALATWCETHAVQLVSDEIYHGIEYAEEPLSRSAWETSREAIVFSSFSKYFSMTGWRIGWMLVPERLRRPVDVLTGNFTICPPAIAQHAAIAAFTEASYDELDGHVRRYAHNRAMLLEGLPRLGITELAPADGAFYAYADIGHLTDDSMAWCLDLLDATGVAVAPGVDFDTEKGNRTIRFSFAGSSGEIATGLDRLATYLG